MNDPDQDDGSIHFIRSDTVSVSSSPWMGDRPPGWKPPRVTLRDRWRRSTLRLRCDMFLHPGNYQDNDW